MTEHQEGRLSRGARERGELQTGVCGPRAACLWEIKYNRNWQEITSTWGGSKGCGRAGAVGRKQQWVWGTRRGTPCDYSERAQVAQTSRNNCAYTVFVI